MKLTASAMADGVAVAAEVQNIDADGSLGELLRTGALGDSLRAKIASGVEGSIRKGLDLKSMVPAVVAGAVSPRSARFESGTGGRLWISMAADVRMSAAQVKSQAKNYLPPPIQADGH